MMPIVALTLALQLHTLEASLHGIYTPNEPVIGVLTFPSEGADESGKHAKKRGATSKSSYIEWAYVRWLEQSGARVVPIYYNLAPKQVEAIFKKVNGVVFTGGPAKPLSAPAPYFKTATHLYQLVKEAYARKEIVPLWGTCLGIQTISCIAAGGKDVTGNFPAFDSYSTNFTKEAASSRLFGGLPENLKKDFQSKVQAHWHHFGVSPEVLATSAPELVPLATTVALNGQTFVAALEGRDGVPVYATQFHPETNQWSNKWKSSSGLPVPVRTPAAIRTVRYLADLFVDQARLNTHKFPSELEESLAVVSQNGKLDILPASKPDNLYPEDAYIFHADASGMQPNLIVTQ